MVKLFIFDMDGTLTASRCPLDQEMSGLLTRLLQKDKIGVISGSSFAQMQRQFLDHFSCPTELLNNLYLLPMDGGSLFVHDGSGWKAVYEKKFSPEEKEKIFDAFKTMFEKFPPTQKPWGELLDDRGGEITFAGLGKDAPLEEKSKWDPAHEKRRAMEIFLKERLPDFDVQIGGTTSIDVTPGGVDKAFGIKKLAEYLEIPVGQIVFAGDAVFEGGNDASAFGLGERVVGVKDAEETKRRIAAYLEKDIF